jgi:hypothetical protein
MPPVSRGKNYVHREQTMQQADSATGTPAAAAPEATPEAKREK